MEKNQIAIISILLFLVLITIFVAYSYDLKTTGLVVVEQNLEFSQGETFLAVISGNFIDQITRENILFYSNSVRVPMIYEVSKINDDFYIYALLRDKSPGNYSLVIQNVRYVKGFKTTDENIVNDFVITEDNADFYVNPGFLTTSGNFFLELQNIQERKINIAIQTSSVFSASENSFELQSGQIKKINFEINKKNLSADSFFEQIKIESENTSYFVPIFVEGVEKEDDEEDVFEFKFEPQKLNVSLATNSTAKRIVYILNIGDYAENITLSFTPSIINYASVSPLSIDFFSNDSIEKIEILFSSDENEKNLTGELIATKGNFSSSLTIFLNFMKDFIPEIPEIEEGSVLPTCEQLNGIICAENERCIGEGVRAKDTSLCCISPPLCEEIPKSSKGKIIGWSIVAIVFLFLLWFFKRYKRVRPKVDLLKIGKGNKYP